MKKNNQEVIVQNQIELERKKEIFQRGGAKKIHVITDFDRTITYGTKVNATKTSSVISKLRSNPKYLGEEYQKEAYRLFDVYHPIEIDPYISLEEKIKKMHEWWQKHYDLIAKVGLTKKIISQVAKEEPLNFRKGAKEFLKELNEKEIPLIVMSAAPGDMVIEYLKENDIFYKNIKVLANRYDFDREGNALKVKEPIIHTFNKKEVSLKDTDVYDKIEKRKNVILLGDSLGDVDMAEGFPYENILKIGFLNENVEERLEEYKKHFDIVLAGDQDFSYVNKLMSKIIK